MLDLKIKVGDIVIIHASTTDWNVRMNEYIGQIRKVSEVCLDNKGTFVNFETDNEDDRINNWYWRPKLHFSPYVRKTKKVKLKF